MVQQCALQYRTLGKLADDMLLVHQCNWMQRVSVSCAGVQRVGADKDGPGSLTTGRASHAWA